MRCNMEFLINNSFYIKLQIINGEGHGLIKKVFIFIVWDLNFLNYNIM